MVNYIRAEFYKVFRRRYTWITLVVLLALEALMVAGWMFTNSHGNHVDFYTGAGMLCVMLALGFYATLLTCDMVFADQYKNGTMKNEVSFGIPRTRIYLGKFLVSLAVSLLFMAVMAAFYLGLCLLTALPLWVGVLACTCAFRFLIKSDLWASVASVCVFAVIPPVMEVCMALFSANPAGTVIRFLYQYMPTVMVDNAPSVVGGWSYCGQAWIVGAVWLAVFSVLGAVWFRRKEIN